jgi:hypothetical protein
METAAKILAIITALVLVVSLTLVALGMMGWKLFWIVTIAAALIAYYVLPKLRGETKTLKSL